MKASRDGLRLADINDPRRLENLADEDRSWLGQWADRLAPMSVDLVPYLRAHRNAYVLFEGAQGALLDLDTGTYPYVSSGMSCAAGAAAQGGVGPRAIDRILGVFKGLLHPRRQRPLPDRIQPFLAERPRRLHPRDGARVRRDHGQAEEVRLPRPRGPALRRHRQLHRPPRPHSPRRLRRAGRVRGLRRLSQSAVASSRIFPARWPISRGPSPSCANSAGGSSRSAPSAPSRSCPREARDYVASSRSTPRRRCRWSPWARTATRPSSGRARGQDPDTRLREPIYPAHRPPRARARPSTRRSSRAKRPLGPSCSKAPGASSSPAPPARPTRRTRRRSILRSTPPASLSSASATESSA